MFKSSPQLNSLPLLATLKGCRLFACISADCRVPSLDSRVQVATGSDRRQISIAPSAAALHCVRHSVMRHITVSRAAPWIRRALHDSDSRMASRCRELNPIGPTSTLEGPRGGKVSVCSAMQIPRLELALLGLGARSSFAPNRAASAASQLFVCVSNMKQVLT